MDKSLFHREDWQMLLTQHLISCIVYNPLGDGAEIQHLKGKLYLH